VLVWDIQKRNGASKLLCLILALAISWLLPAFLRQIQDLALLGFLRFAKLLQDPDREVVNILPASPATRLPTVYFSLFQFFDRGPSPTAQVID
jgi:hypothetical protein